MGKKEKELCDYLRHQLSIIDSPIGDLWGIVVSTKRAKDLISVIDNLAAELEEMTHRNDENSGMCKIWARRYEELKKRLDSRYTVHDVAVILSEATGDECACNVNGNDEWLPFKCELQDLCPDAVGVVCWEQYLKWKEGEKK